MNKGSKGMKKGPTKVREREHDFTLILDGITDLTAEVEDALFEAGCDDATLNLRCGRAYLTFSRAAATLADAVLSAIQDVQKAGIGARVLRVDSNDFVTQADIAHRIGRTRQLIHQYIKGTRGPGGFPAPVYHVSEDAPLWAWCDVAQWLERNDLIREGAAAEALQLAVINTALAADRLIVTNPRLTRWFFRAVGLNLAKPRDAS
jgi:hypothetical protein